MKKKRNAFATWLAVLVTKNGEIRGENGEIIGENGVTKNGEKW